MLINVNRAAIMDPLIKSESQNDGQPDRLRDALPGTTGKQLVKQATDRLINRTLKSIDLIHLLPLATQLGVLLIDTAPAWLR